MQKQLHNNEEIIEGVSEWVRQLMKWRIDDSKGVSNQANNRSGIQIIVSRWVNKIRKKWESISVNKKINEQKSE